MTAADFIGYSLLAESCCDSNSFVHTLIKKEGLPDLPPPVNVPGWDHILY